MHKLRKSSWHRNAYGGPHMSYKEWRRVLLFQMHKGHTNVPVSTIPLHLPIDRVHILYAVLVWCEYVHLITLFKRSSSIWVDLFSNFLNVTSHMSVTCSCIGNWYVVLREACSYSIWCIGLMLACILAYRNRIPKWSSYIPWSLFKLHHWYIPFPN